MAYDEALAERIREVLAAEPDLTERRMFGGLAFLIGGNMAVAAAGPGGLMVRIPPDEGERLIAAGEAAPMEMRGGAISGWLYVDAAGLSSASELATWVERGVATARALPPKPPKRG